VFSCQGCGKHDEPVFSIRLPNGEKCILCRLCTQYVLERVKLIPEARKNKWPCCESCGLPFMSEDIGYLVSTDPKGFKDRDTKQLVVCPICFGLYYGDEYLGSIVHF